MTIANNRTQHGACSCLCLVAEGEQRPAAAVHGPPERRRGDPSAERAGGGATRCLRGWRRRARERAAGAGRPTGSGVRAEARHDDGEHAARLRRYPHDRRRRERT